MFAAARKNNSSFKYLGESEILIDQLLDKQPIITSVLGTSFFSETFEGIDSAFDTMEESEGFKVELVESIDEFFDTEFVQSLTEKSDDLSSTVKKIESLQISVKLLLNEIEETPNPPLAWIIAKQVFLAVVLGLLLGIMNSVLIPLGLVFMVTIVLLPVGLAMVIGSIGLTMYAITRLHRETKELYKDNAKVKARRKVIKRDLKEVKDAAAKLAANKNVDQMDLARLNNNIAELEAELD